MDVSFAVNTSENMNLLIPGIYDFIVLDATNEVSKKGNEMIKLILRIKNDDKTYNIFDYLVATEAAAFKIKQFAQCVGLENELTKGKISNTDCFEKTGTAEITIKSDETGQYPDKNVVKRYIFSRKENALRESIKQTEAMYKTNQSTSFIDDELPF